MNKGLKLNVASLLIVVLSLIPCVSVYAEDNVSYVTYNQESAFTVTIPKSIELTKDVSTVSYKYSVQGDVEADKMVYVNTPSTVNLIDSNGKEDIILTVNHPKKYFTWYEVDKLEGRTAIGYISFSGLSAGDWKGSLEFEIKLIDALQAGGYDNEGKLICAWEGLGVDDSMTYSAHEDNDRYCRNMPKSGSSILNSYSDIKCLVLPNGMSYINNALFCECENLECVILPYGLEDIHENAFRSCKSLKDVVIPDTVKSIGHKAFAYCDSIMDLYIPTNVKDIEEYAFDELRHIEYNGVALGSPWSALSIN